MLIYLTIVDGCDIRNKSNGVCDFDGVIVVSVYLPGLHAHIVKNLSRHVILDMIRFTSGGISRAEIARQMDLTRAAITTIVDDLVQKELVRESASGPATGGRKPILLEINPKHGFVVGIDIGATHAGLVIADFSASVLHEAEFPLDINRGPEVCLPVIDTHLRRQLDQLNLPMSQILAIGVGVPGPVVAEAGAVSSPPIMPGWDNFPIRKHLHDLWGVPITLNNDAELGALGEWAYGAGRSQQNLAYIKVGTGIGSGLLLDGQVYRGATGCAGEIGHITIQENGPLCSCGSYGCLEALAGGRAIARKAREAVLAGRRTQLAIIEPVEAISARDVAEAARLGDLVAQQIVTTAGGYLGIAIADLVNLFNPGLVVVGGGVAQMGDLLLDPIRRAVRERSLRPAAQAVRITAAVLGRRSSSMGAVVQAISLALH
jgi:glucokinase-like ROK family protein